MSRRSVAAKETARYGVAAVVIALVVMSLAVETTPLAITSPPSPRNSPGSQGSTVIQLGSSPYESSQSGSGILSVYLTDAPPSGAAFKYLLVNVTSVEVAYQGGITTGKNSSAGNTFTLTVPPNVGMDVNLSSLQGQSLPLGAASLPAGIITSTVLNIAGAKAFYTGGLSQQLKVFAGGKLAVPLQFGLPANGLTDLTLDLTPNSVSNSQGGVLTPVILATSVEKGQSGTTTRIVTFTETLPATTSTVTTTRTVSSPTTLTTTIITPTTTTQTVTSVTNVTTTLTTPTTTTQTVTSTTTLPPSISTSTTTQTYVTTEALLTTTTSTATETSTTTTTSTTTATSTTTVTSPATTTQTVTSTTTLPPTTTTASATSTTTVTTPTTTTQTVTSTTTLPPSTTTSTVTVTKTKTTTTTVTHGIASPSQDSTAPVGPGSALASAGANAEQLIAAALALGALLVAGVTSLALPRFRRSAPR